MSQHRYDTFLSHSSNDKPVVETLARLLKKNNIEAWIDLWHLIPGKPWQDEIEEALDECATCCVCIGRGDMGPWQNEEMRAAINRRVEVGRGFRVIPVLLPNCARPERSKLPTFLTRTTWVEFTDTIEDKQALHRLLSAIRGVAPGAGPGQSVFEGVCPYRGLEVFKVQHAPFFYGRNALTEWLLNEIKPQEGRLTNRFLAIIGASGSGKSSLARAGLLSALKNDELPGSADWSSIVLTPGNDPLESMALKLANSAAEVETVKKALFKNPAHLHIETRFRLQNKSESHRVVILVDQFEEVFTLCRDSDLRGIFIDSLLNAAHEPLGQTIIILTLRADFYGKCAEYELLAAAMADHQLLVSAMNENELRAAIEQPAVLAGCELEPGLTDLLLKDIRGQAGALPLLEFALKRLWENRHGNRLVIDEYHKIGGLQGALEKRADEIYRAFNDEQKAACRLIFLRLTEPGEGTEDTRRRARLSELPNDRNSRRVLEELTRTRLVSVDEDAKASESVVEVTHEALIRGWPQLKSWIEADRESLRIQHRLSEATREWLRFNKEPGYLYAKGRLSQAEEWAKDRLDTISDDERAFLNASVDQRDEEALQLEQQRQLDLANARELVNEKTRAARNIAIGALVATVLAITATTAGIIAWNQNNQAQAKTEEAEKERKRADEQNRLAKLEATNARIAEEHAKKDAERARRGTYNIQLLRAADELHRDPNFSLQLLNDTNYFPVGLRDFAWRYLSRLAKRDRKTVTLSEGIPDAGETAFSLDGRILATENASHIVKLWETDSGKQLAALDGHDADIVDMAFSPDGKMLALAVEDGTIVLWETHSNGKRSTLRGHTDKVRRIAFAPDSNTLASLSWDGNIKLWDIANKKESATLKYCNNPLCRNDSLDFSPDGKTLALGGEWIRLWDVKTGEERSVLKGQRNSFSIKFSPDGKTLASMTDQGVELWDLESSKLRATLSVDPILRSIAFSPDSTTVATASRKIRLWDVDSGQELVLLQGYRSQISSVAFSPDGRSLISASESYNQVVVKTWDIEVVPARNVRQSDKKRNIQSMAVTPDEKTVAVGFYKAIELWDVSSSGHHTMIKQLDFESGQQGMTFSPDGNTLAVKSWSVVRLLNVDSGLEMDVDIHHDDYLNGVAFSPDGKILATTGKENTVKLWDVATGALLNTLTGHKNASDPVAFSPDGKTLASGSWDRTIKLWDTTSGQELATLRGHTGSVYAVAFHPNGKILASGDIVGTVRFWELGTGQQLEVLKGHKSSVYSLAFTPNGEILASASSDHTIRLWDAVTGQERAILRGHIKEVETVSFASDGMTLISQGADVVKLWEGAKPH